MGLDNLKSHEKTYIRKLSLKVVINFNFIESRYLKLADSFHVKKIVKFVFTHSFSYEILTYVCRPYCTTEETSSTETMISPGMISPGII